MDTEHVSITKVKPIYAWTPVEKSWIFRYNTITNAQKGSKVEVMASYHFHNYCYKIKSPNFSIKPTLWTGWDLDNGQSGQGKCETKEIICPNKLAPGFIPEVQITWNIHISYMGVFKDWSGQY